ncbi:hypothetical protein ACK8HJ_22185 [Vreelandella titanicae]|uniref:HNH endonuclease 5 domain-containing protein n=1 Tax=Vreelandella titanicae BH1 TaxID=1204738 RepID=L9UBF2_9GAMM|nr:hypothetical protein [Halomonas titanicae]ELY22214.1 hypothetical protein HALTITAN_0778 [Halomonas titanicae BH1]NVE89704.1 hypothetical protein [Halomonas titanicae]
MPVCSYCENECSLTREHIIPNFLYRYQKRNGGHIGWNEGAQKIIGGEAQIKDVCQRCNNGVLHDLDDYGREFLENAGIFVENFLIKQHVVYYDYCSLLRWLLKISFNSARASKNQASVFEYQKGFILNGSGSSDAEHPKETFLLAGLVKPASLSEDEAKKYASQLPISDEGFSNPFFIRLSWVPAISGSHVIRLVVIGALVFHLVIFNNEVKPGFRRSQVRRWLKENKGMQLVDPAKKAITLTQNDISFLDHTSMQLGRDKHREAAENLLTSSFR